MADTIRSPIHLCTVQVGKERRRLLNTINIIETNPACLASPPWRTREAEEMMMMIVFCGGESDGNLHWLKMRS